MGARRPAGGPQDPHGLGAARRRRRRDARRHARTGRRDRGRRRERRRPPRLAADAGRRAHRVRHRLPRRSAAGPPGRHALAIPLTLLWIVGLTNAFNLMDGLDGLATGLAIIAAATCAAVSISRGDSQGGLLLVALLGALCGFLPYNFNPATIFLGDSGSLVVGYALAVTAVTGWQKGATALAVAVPLLIFALPISETLLSVVRRTRGLGIRHVFSADQQHLHYRLLGLGLSHRAAVLLLYVVSLSLSLLALATMQMR
ncbi:MAG: undecaprenyl/decaprenyl-phosphate alpha-N-acetylglucosaminyl 1-phosphate transferase [Candidatus Rokuibacteriota bacterium]|nr:MAG: undecaprenyl/decaprenyl-phosphate alpha-N-acetylglucosaminyl 1-phosphate transferase [Candidatus Rokubacteria bacterium]